MKEKIKKNKSATSTLKAKFRTSVAWKDFRKQKMVEQKGLDPITKRRLTKRFHNHHIIQTNDLDVYRDLSDPSHFIAVNSATHDALHWALHLVYYNGWEAFERFIDEVKRECKLNDFI